jgi:methylated-DNA-[protein]-cysteine S-methyltransferase
MQLAVTSIDTPLGRYVLVASERGLVQAFHEGRTEAPRAAATVQGAARRMVAAASEAFGDYFAGSCSAFAELAVDPHGSEFQRRVWHALREIPVGTTASYAEIARKVGSPGAARAVGDANRRNPIAIAVPCHRVIGGDGRLVGYAGGLERKRWLLAHEAEWANPSHGASLGFASLRAPLRGACGQAASSKSDGPDSAPLRTVSRSRSRAAASI